MLFYPRINLRVAGLFLSFHRVEELIPTGKKCIPIDEKLDFFLTKGMYRNREEPAEADSPIDCLYSAFGPAYLCSNNKLIYMMYLNVMKEEVE